MEYWDWIHQTPAVPAACSNPLQMCMVKAWKKFLYRLWGMGVIGYMDEKLLDSCCGLRYISDLRLDYLKA